MAAIQGVPSGQAHQKKKQIVVTEPPKFDLEGYIQNYQGRTRFERLLLIGTTSTYLGVDALKAAVTEAKAGRDIKRYLEAQSQLRIIAPQEPEAIKDKAWIETVDKENQAKTALLEANLKSYKNNLIKESVRMGNEDLGNHYQSIGEPVKAFESFSRMRQDVSIGKQIVDISHHLIEVALEQKNFVAVASNVQQIRGVQSTPEDEKAIQPFLSAADGLARLDAGEYYLAARAFLNTDSGIGTSCNTIISPNDIAVYGGLTALASMDRKEIQKRVLENSSFRAYLELEPHIRKAISFFVNSRYSACLAILEGYRTDYLLDIHLQRHVETIYSLVRTKSIVQYFIPFSCVTLDSLAAAFTIPNSPNNIIEKELANMIERKELDGRIDTQNRLLISLNTVPREKLQREALETARKYEKEAKLRIQHMGIVAAELEVRGVKKGQSHGVFENDFSDGYGEGSAWGGGGNRQLRSRGGSWQ